MNFSSLFFHLNRLKLWHARIHAWGSLLQATSLDRCVYLRLHQLGIMGGKVKAFFESKIQRGMTIVDVGANIGLYTIFFAKQTGSGGKVFAFEPDPDLFQMLRKNCETNNLSNVILHNCALGSCEDEKFLDRSPLNSGDNRIVANSPLSVSHGKRVKVRTAALDTLLPGQNVDFLKIDVQGYELEVLKGAKDLLSKSPSLQLYFEYSPYGMELAGCRPTDILELLSKLGYETRNPYDRRQALITDWRAYTDQIPRGMWRNLWSKRKT